EAASRVAPFPPTRPPARDGPYGTSHGRNRPHTARRDIRRRREDRRSRTPGGTRREPAEGGPHRAQAGDVRGRAVPVRVGDPADEGGREGARAHPRGPPAFRKRVS